MPPLDATYSEPEPIEAAVDAVADPASASPLDAARSDLRIRPAADADLHDLRQDNLRLETLRRHLQKDVVVKDAYLTHLRADLRAKDRDIAGLRETVTGLHRSIADTLRQPRYRAVDVLNARLHQLPFLHRMLKRWLTAKKA